VFPSLSAPVSGLRLKWLCVALNGLVGSWEGGFKCSFYTEDKQKGLSLELLTFRLRGMIYGVPELVIGNR
jgi:hypothetical protein